MRYTKYNYKKRKNNDIWKAVLSFVAMSVFVVIVGVLLANVIIFLLPLNNANEANAGSNTRELISGENQDNGAITNNDVVDDTVNVNADMTDNNSNLSSFAIVQCGYFSTSENANTILNKISGDYSSFIFDDGGKFKVLAGIYDINEVDAVINKLTADGIENARITINLNSSDDVQNQVAAICDGYLKVLNTSLDSDVKLISTEDFKEWVSKLEAVESGEKIEVLNALKSHISECPSEIKKEDVAQEMQFIYTILINFN